MQRGAPTVNCFGHQSRASAGLTPSAQSPSAERCFLELRACRVRSCTTTLVSEGADLLGLASSIVRFAVLYLTLLGMERR